MKQLKALGLLPLLLLLPLLPLAACGTPGKEVKPPADDFAFVEVRLRG